MSDSPNPIKAGFSMLKALRLRKPSPQSRRPAPDHSALASVLAVLADGGVPALGGQRRQLAEYRTAMEAVDPDELSRDDALAYWLNLYNAGALDLAAEAAGSGEVSVLRVPGAFDQAWATIAGEELSLNDIEHGKIRRFGDPRIHGALVCGSASCPTLRYEPYSGLGLGEQLDKQMRAFLKGGGAATDGTSLLLSRIFLWYGADFVRPNRMPSLLPVTKTAVREALRPWLDDGIADLPVEFQTYDWGLACSIS